MWILLVGTRWFGYKKSLRPNIAWLLVQNWL